MARPGEYPPARCTARDRSRRHRVIDRRDHVRIMRERHRPDVPVPGELLRLCETARCAGAHRPDVLGGVQRANQTLGALRVVWKVCVHPQ